MTGDMMHDVSQSQEPAPGDDLESLAGRVACAIAALDSLDAASRERAYAAREAIVKRLKEDPRGKELFFELVDDPGVRVLLAMHGIIPTASLPTASPPTALEPPLELVQIRLPGDTNGWCSGPQADAVTAEKPVAFEGGGAKILVLRVKDGFRAFRNACGHVGLPLERGRCDVEAGTITCPWHGFRFDADTGECLSAPQCQLEPFPLRVEAGVIWVKPS